LAQKRVILLGLLVAALVVGMLALPPGSLFPDRRSVPRESPWGIYALDPTTGALELLYASSTKLTRIRLNAVGDCLVFSKRITSDPAGCVLEGTPIDRCLEICSVRVDGSGFQRLTDDTFMDLCPSWSADDSQIAFLSFRDDLDLFTMQADGSNPLQLYDSGSHDSDLHSSGNTIVFTRSSQIWRMNGDGTQITQVTTPPRAGEWGDAVLPFGDYDPNVSPDGTQIVFERLVDDQTPHGNYDLYVINSDGSGEIALTHTGYTQGLPAWAHSGEQIVYVVSAIGLEGHYDIYRINADGSDNHNLTPAYFPGDFLCHDPIFSIDDSHIFFIGEWYTPPA
jgi:Tol biopolymer transport system component